MLRLRSIVYSMIATAALIAPSASAQVEPLDPVWMAVASDDGADLRSGDLDTFYKVAALKPGQLVRATGKSVGWMQVEYPAGIGVFVSAKDAEVARPGSVRLTADSKLLAPSMLLGLNGSWRTLLSEALPAGTELKLVDTVTGVGGRVAGFSVEIPRGVAAPKGYVKAAALRNATESEISAQLAAIAAAEQTAPKPAEVKKSEIAAATPAKAESQPAGEPTEVATDDAAAQTETEVLSLADDMVEPEAGEPAFAVGDETETQTPAEDVTLARPADPAPVRATPAVDARGLQLIELEQRLERMRSMPQAQQDDAIEELLEAYRTAQAEETDATNSRRLAQRVAFLELKIDLRDQRRALDAALADADTRTAEAARLASEFRSGRQYSAVGRIVPSIVYDGERLPRMFRVQAVGGVGSRTIGYVRASDRTDPASYRGELVGIFGEVRYDSTLRLNIITPERIEVIPLAPAARP